MHACMPCHMQLPLLLHALMVLHCCACARSYTGAGLWNRMSTSFGYLNKFGYGGHVFPVVIGESGSYYTDVHPLLPISHVSA